MTKKPPHTRRLFFYRSYCLVFCLVKNLIMAENMVGATRFERATSTTPILITQFLHHAGGSCNALLEPVCESAFLFPFPFCPISSYRLRTLLLDLLLDSRKSTLAGALSVFKIKVEAEKEKSPLYAGFTMF